MRRYCIIKRPVSRPNVPLPAQRPHRKLTIFTLLGACWALAATAAQAQIDSRANVERAVGLIDHGEHTLARSYLAPALIDPRLSPHERSRAYYLRGYSFFAEAFYVSASKDYYRALEFNPDNPAALAALGNLHLRGLGVTRAPEIAYQLFSQAAHHGHIGARFQVAVAEINAIGTAGDLESARRWLEDLAEQGHARALVHLGRSFRQGIADQPDPQVAKRWYERAWQAGDPEGLVGLAFMHQTGEFGQANVERAIELFNQAAAAGSGNAQVSLGHMYLTGESLGQDYGKALALFKQAAELGVPAAYLWLGHIFEAGLGVKPNLPAAESWYRKAVSNDVAPALTPLIYLLLAKDTLRDDREALSLLAKAAQTDNPQAHNDYAWVLATHLQPTLRNGELALQHAEQAVAMEATPTYLDTLAAAYAELGDFANAIATQEAALELLDDAQRDLKAELENRLAVYRAGQAWRE